jgi:hypothetical protein
LATSSTRPHHSISTLTSMTRLLIHTHSSIPLTNLSSPYSLPAPSVPPSPTQPSVCESSPPSSLSSLSLTTPTSFLHTMITP